MTFWAIVCCVFGTVLGQVLLNVLSNECSDLSPWLAGRLVRWAARRQYRGSERAAIRAEEWASLVQERPGKLLKLLTAVRFAAVALVRPGRRGRVERRPLLPRLGRASAQAGLALVVAFLTAGAEYVLVSAIAGYGYDWSEVLGTGLGVGLFGGVYAALETLGRGLLRLRPGMLSGILTGTVALSATLIFGDLPDAEDTTMMLRMVLVGMLGVYFAAKLLARGRKGVAVYLATVIGGIGTLSMLVAYDSTSSYDSGIAMAGTAAMGALLGLTVGLGVTVASRALGARPTTAAQV